MNRLLFDNPVLIKHIRIRLRRPQAIYLGIVVLSLCLCSMWAGWKFNGLGNGAVFTLLVWCIGAVLQLVGTSQVANSISQTNETGILDFHRIAPLPPHTTALGFVLGGPVREYLIAGMIVPFALFCSLSGEPGLAGFAAISTVMLSTTLLFHMLAMNAGLLSKRGKTRGTSMGLAFLLVMASFSTSTVLTGLPIPGLLTVGPTFLEAMDKNGELLKANLPTFFGLHLPLFLQSLIYQIPLIIFLSIPVVRRMRSAQASLYSKPAATGCLATISVLNLGGIVKHPQLEPAFFVPMLLYFSVIIAILLTLAVTPSRSRYLNLVRRSKKQNMLKPSLWQDESCNRAILFVFGSFVWATVQLADTFIVGKAIGQDFLIMTGTAFSVVIYFGCALQFFALKFGRKSRPVFMLFLFLFWLMPLAVAALALSANPDIAPLIAAMSPVYGIGSGSIPGLIAAVAMGTVFFALSVREEIRIQTDFAGDPFEEEEDDDDRPQVHDKVDSLDTN